MGYCIATKYLVTYKTNGGSNYIRGHSYFKNKETIKKYDKRNPISFEILCSDLPFKDKYFKSFIYIFNISIE